MGTPVTVVASHIASYANPIAVKAGEQLVLTGREDLWDGYRWLWAVAPDSTAGWIPDSLVEDQGGTLLATKDYFASELTCEAGEQLTLHTKVRNH